VVGVLEEGMRRLTVTGCWAAASEIGVWADVYTWSDHVPRQEQHWTWINRWNAGVPDSQAVSMVFLLRRFVPPERVGMAIICIQPNISRARSRDLQYPYHASFAHLPTSHSHFPAPA
jgi:hypothetical protein